MFKVALCGFKDSKHIIDAKIFAFLGSSTTGYTIFEYKTIEELVEVNEFYDLYFINKKLRENENLLIQQINEDNKTDKKKLRFITYADDPVSDNECDGIIDCIKRHIEYDSMYLAIEFLTDKGLRSIAVSKILFFEYGNRKIKIKTHSNEYYCDDTLQNISSLVGGYDFLQPHKSFIVNIKHITCIKNYLITMNDSTVIPLSQKKSNEFRKAYKKYLEKHNTRIRKRKPSNWH